MPSFKITMYLRSPHDTQTTLKKIKRALEVTEGFTVDDLKAEANQVSQPTPNDVPDDWAPIRRPGDFVTITEDPVDIIPEPRPITADLDPPPPEEPNAPACDLRCADCDGDDHHWLTDISHGFADDEPDHPAARAGHAAWDICKHCPAWRAVPDEIEELRCQMCKGPPEVVIMLPMLGTFCRWHAIQAGRESLKSSGGVMPKFDIEVGTFHKNPDLVFKIQNRIKATPQSKILHCPNCESQHIDTGDWKEIPHKTHRCAHCNAEWRPFDYCTVGVSAMPDAVQVRGESKRRFGGINPGVAKLKLIETTPEDYPCKGCRDFADNGNPRTYPTPEEPVHPDCPYHYSQEQSVDDFTGGDLG